MRFIKEHIRDLTDEYFPKAPSFREIFRRLSAALKKRGRPKLVAPKAHIGFRLAADVVAGIRASGPGYNARVETALRAALAKGEV